MTAFLTSFVNDYSWGDFKGMQTYGWTTFDVFLFPANWGTRILKLRLKSRRTLRLRGSTRLASTPLPELTNGSVIISVHSENEDVEDSVESEGPPASLFSVRSELARGDLRAQSCGECDAEQRAAQPWRCSPRHGAPVRPEP